MLKNTMLGMVMIILICSMNNAWAGDRTFWLNFGPGGSTVDEGNTLMANVSYQYKHHVITFRSMTTGTALLSKGKTMWDYGLLYNYAVNPSSFHFSVGSGIAIVGGSIDHDGFNPFTHSEVEHLKTTVGLPVDIQAFWRPLSFLGLGVYGFANINSEESFSGFALCLQIGKLK